MTQEGVAQLSLVKHVYIKHACHTETTNKPTRRARNMKSLSLSILLSLAATAYLLPISQVTEQDEDFATVGNLSVP